MLYHKLTVKHWFILIILSTAMIIASIHPLEMSSYILHQVGTVFMLILLLGYQKKVGLSFYAFNCYILFLLVHISAAHYLYSYVPYNDWIQTIFKFDLNKSMDWQRNMYDRLVHFLYGLLLYPFCYRIFQVWLPSLNAKTLYILVIQFIMASSLFYEWIEWLIAITLSPEAAEQYNGQQGDLWDAHADMLLATIGAIIMGFFLLLKEKNRV